jgi:hypothetical protein
MVQTASTTRDRPKAARPWWRGRAVARLLPLLAILGFCLLLQDRRRSDPDSADGSGGSEAKVQVERLTGGAADEFLAGLAGSPHQAFPANIPWEALREVAVRREQAIEQLINDHPTEFLQMCLDRYDRKVQGYSCTLVKKERVAGNLKPLEVVEAHFREQPFSVFMEWKKGAGKAKRVLYVEGENNDKMLARPPGILGIAVFTRDVDATDVKASGRYLITQFGIKLGAERTLRAMLSAKAKNTLHVKYEGVFTVPELGNRSCYKLVRTPYDPPEDMEGVNELTIYIDTETWLQVGSILKNSAGDLIAEYFFRNIKINPAFKANQFKPSAL